MLKRTFDIISAVFLVVLLLPVFIVIAAWMYAKRDLPILYISERMKKVDQSFQLYKFRTMSLPSSEESNTGVSGGDKEDRITPFGRRLRKYRLDELPQLINILRGDMSLVGPRPPLRRYTDKYRKIYEQVLRNKPGVTGLASMSFHKHEEWLLKQARTPEETEFIYTTRCIPWKARIDLIYQKNASILLDICIIVKTVMRVFK